MNNGGGGPGGIDGIVLPRYCELTLTDEEKDQLTRKCVDLLLRGQPVSVTVHVHHYIIVERVILVIFSATSYC